MALKAVFFDLGDTVLNFGNVNVGELFSRGAKLTYEYLMSCEGVEGQPCLPSFERYRRGNIWAIKQRYAWAWLTRLEFDCLKLLEDRTRAMGFVLRREQLERLAWLWYEPLAHVADTEGDLEQTLGRLRELGLRLAIISNTFVPRVCHEHQLRELGLLDYFEVRQYSSETIFRKPDPRIYRMTLEAMGLAGEDVMMVGDKYHPDVRGPRRVGMRGVFKLGETNRRRWVPRDVIRIEHLSELPDLVQPWL